MWLWAVGGIAVLAFVIGAGAVNAQESLLDAHLDTSVDFPDTLTFTISADVPFEVEKAEVHYSIQQLSCGTGTSTGVATVTPGDPMTASWEWDLRDSGGLPVGARIEYSWVVTGDGRTLETAQQTITFDDPRHDWRSVSGEHVQILWYEGSEAFANDLLDAASQGVSQLHDSTGVLPSEPVPIRVYDSPEAMQETVLYAQEWAGGIAFPHHGLVVMGISVDNLSWGRTAMVHEMTHVILGQHTFACGASLPAWLNEGLAVYNEGPVATIFARRLDRAVNDNSVYTLRGIAGSFPTSEEGALLAYAQSQNIVAFMIDTYGPDKMEQLLSSFPTVRVIDHALEQVYGFDTDGLQERWRESLGLPPSAAVATVEPIPIPTIPPLGGLPLDQPTPTPTSTAVATPAPEPTPTSTPAPSSGFGCNRSSAPSSGLDGTLVVGLLLGTMIAGRKRFL